MIYEEQTKQIHAVCEKLLDAGEFDLIIAYRDGGICDQQVPFFAETKEDIKKIEWGDRCYQNLATYLYSLKRKAAIVAKPCDVRAIIQYMTEKQVNREDVYIIGVDCKGIVDEDGNPRPGCEECAVRIPPIYDEHIKDDSVRDKDGANLRRPAADPPQDPECRDDNDDDLAENFEKFQKEISKCILCYACRQACYGCYCKTCFIERDAADWQPAEVDEGTKMTFHMGRAMHLAGRCVECGACESSCQSGVNVRYIIKEVTKFIDDEYGYNAGMDPDEKPALLTNKFDDREVGFLGDESGGAHG